ncbi:RdRP-domain-containing protein [Plenodomus tracheiphilus IPT5]|uniref:RNA-dependent RNA polymerase n=1 Tax=Plenodomus tracheiphilus IPT5 TaxID=1408161 RepID=A0A6A7BNS7_9PLEO|nr:RdRP-domain-containing protein [Plenodomus tracheiphilus IPT5]
MSITETVVNEPTGNDPPNTPVKQQSSFDLSGNQINETFTPRSSPLASPSKLVSRPSPSPRKYGPQQRNSLGGYSARQRPVMKGGDKHWVYQQEAKIKILGIPKALWTKDIYLALSPYGNVARIEMQLGSRDNNAWIIFQPPPSKALPDTRVRVGAIFLKYEILSPLINSIPSPVKPSKYYYEVNMLPAKAISFGARVADLTMTAMQTTQSSDGIYLVLNLKRKELDIQFPLDVSGQSQRHRFRLPIALVSQIYKIPSKHAGQTDLIIPFDSPPQFFIQRGEGEHLQDGSVNTSFTVNEKTWSAWNTWFRETDIVESHISERLLTAPLMNHKDTAIIDLGRWTTYQISFGATTLSGAKFQEFRDALADHGIVIQDLSHYGIQSKTASPLWSVLQEEISGTHPHLQPASTVPIFDDLFATQVHLSFPVRYQLEACLSNGYLKEHSLSKNFLEKLAAMEPRRAVHILEKVVDKQHVYYDPMDVFSIKIRGSLERKVPDYCVLQRSVIVTPTMMHVASPVMEISNRIIRKYAADADRFIRVKFSDEKTEGVLRNMPGNRAEAVFSRVHRAMTNGIVVAGRYYEFLAFGNSQFREHGAYFYAPTSSKSADDIRLSLGEFRHIKTVAKFGARIGQCFSTTRAMRITVGLKEIADVQRNGYNFTDGVGKLSLFIAQMAAQELGLPNPFEDPPTLYQFRLGGCKGVLALDPKIQGSEVHVRPSQHKFVAHYTGLEIIRSSALTTPFFNRQIIMVLSNLGVPDQVFIRKQQEMVNDYENAMSDEHIAVQKLRKHIDMSQSTLAMAGMVLDGFMKSQEPFIMSLLMLWRSHTIKNLKEKARIAIEDGAFVLGCVDETALLKGHMDDPQSRLDATQDEKLATLPEIFLQVDDTTKSGHYKIIEGICVLARNPSLHPGDLRIVRAVNIWALHHLKNVVVLPQAGDRDLANMCSGGDLDGDDYMVLWDDQLLPKIINVPPMDFTPEKPIETEKPITSSDISDFFVTYMKNDSLGQIAHAHLAQADLRADGINDPTCLELAKLHSQAVDYPKSGIPAVMNRELRPSKYPHFMEKRHLPPGKTYISKKILGMLYDQVQLVNFQPQWENAFDKRILEAYNLDETLLRTVNSIKVAYDESLRRLMAKHGIRTEFEAWTVFVLAHNQESRDYKFAEEFGRTVSALKEQYRDICRRSAEVTGVADWTRLGPFVAAMYTVTAREMETALRECRTTKTVGGKETPARMMDQEHMPLISFPWIFASELGTIATNAKAARESEPVRSQQNVFHRQKKSGRASESQTGVVETEGGTTRYGELLKLDFGPTQLEHERWAEQFLPARAIEGYARTSRVLSRVQTPPEQGALSNDESIGHVSTSDVGKQTSNALQQRGEEVVLESMEPSALESLTRRFGTSTHP